jgi:DNA-binding IclR family transcriptional regulator
MAQTAPAVPAAPGADDKNRIQSYRRMMDVLQCFSTSARRLTLAQIAMSTGLPRPTVHRILGALKEIGFIEQDVKGGGYMLGIGLYELGSLSLANMDLHREAQPFVEQLARQCSASVHLGIFNGHAVVLIERGEVDEPRKRLSARLETAPIHCTGVGKAVGAFLPDEVVHRVAAEGLQGYTPHTLTTLAALQRDYAKIRRRGYALDNEELQLFVRCVAAPIRNASGRVFAGISVSGPADRMTADLQQQLAPIVVETALAISRHLGFAGG